MSQAPIRFISAADIRRSLTFPALITAMEEAHRQAKAAISDTMLGSESELYFVRDAVVPGRAMGSKLITSFPANPSKGPLPAVQALYVLFDGADGRPLAVIDGTEITYWKTAADSALGARLLANPDPRSLLMVGAGEMSPWLARAHVTVRPSIEMVWIWNRTPARAQAVAAALSDAGVRAEAVADLEAAVRRADMISCCTRSDTPLVKGAWLRLGQHLDLVGGYTPTTREADDEAARRALIFVDRMETAFDGVGDILGPIASGAITREDVRGDLYDLVGGRVSGRRSAEDITLFKNAGGGHLDLMTAEAILSAVGR